MKGVGAAKEFVTGREKNSKLLTRSDPNILRVFFARLWVSIDQVTTNGKNVKETPVDMNKTGFC